MGNACWGGGVAVGEPKTGRNKAYSLKNSEGQYKTSAWSNEFVAKNWKEDTENIWKRPLSALSCHMDLPRLGLKISILEQGKQIPIDENQNILTTIKQILLTIARQAGEPVELIQKITNSYFEYINEDGSGDTSQQLKRFLEEVIPDDSKIHRILCLCHQKIVFPAYYSIKDNIHNDLPFKDCRGSWTISINFEQDGACDVAHSKVQMAKDANTNEDAEFSFRWELELHLSGSRLENLDKIETKVVELNLRNNLPNATKQNIEAVFAKHYNL